MSNFRTMIAPSTSRRPTDVTLPETLLHAGRDLHIDVSQACERGLALEIEMRRQQQWLLENRPAMDEWNDYVEKDGLPLAEYRDF